MCNQQCQIITIQDFITAIRKNLHTRFEISPGFIIKTGKHKFQLLIQDPRCQICRTSITEVKLRKHKRNPLCVVEFWGNGQFFDIDHIVRQADGGKNNPENLQILCRSCHIIKDSPL